MTQEKAGKKRRSRRRVKPLKPNEVQTISSILRTSENWRDLALFRLGIDSMLRASDLVSIYLDEVLDHNGEIRSRTEIMMKKTGNPVQIAIMPDTRDALRRWIGVRPEFAGEWLFPGRYSGAHFSVVRYREIAKRWFKAAGLDIRQYSTHSLRRSKAAEIYRQTKNLKAVSLRLGHRDMNVTSEYLGIEDEDSLELAEKINI